MSKTLVTVTHRPALHTFDTTVDGLRCFADYRHDGDTIRMTHTVVPPALEGQGIAAQLVHTALTWIDAEKLTLDPVCSYVRVYVQRHPQWQRLLA